MVVSNVPVIWGSSVTVTVTKESHPITFVMVSIPLKLLPLYNVPLKLKDVPLQSVVSNVPAVGVQQLMLVPYVSKQP